MGKSLSLVGCIGAAKENFQKVGECRSKLNLTRDMTPPMETSVVRIKITQSGNSNCTKGQLSLSSLTTKALNILLLADSCQNWGTHSRKTTSFRSSVNQFFKVFYRRKTEREGFEPSLELPLNSISSAAPSTTRPSLQGNVTLIEPQERYSSRIQVYSEQNP